MLFLEGKVNQDFLEIKSGLEDFQDFMGFRGLLA
jgi:hypothetical protein